MTAASVTRWMFGLAVAAAAMVLVLAQAAHAQEAKGAWHGAVATPAGALRLQVEIAEGPGGALSGRIFSVDQGVEPAPLSEVRMADGKLSFAVPQVSGRFDGRWDAAKAAWAGQWVQGAALPLTLEKGEIAPGPVVAGLDGRWEGGLTAGAARLRLTLRVRTGPWGTIAALDSPDQLTYGLKVGGLSHAADQVRFDVPLVRGTFEGKLAADGRTLDGVWTQGGRPLPLTLVKSEQAAASGPKRPQTPQAPFPYRAEDVAFDSAAGVKLAGTLTLPQGKGPFPAAVMITGSGPQDRDETLLGHKPFAVIADDLTRRGVAVLRYDDRGFGKSTGDFAAATSEDFAVDARAALAFLRTRSDIDPRRLGLIGHSEGGMVAPLAALKEPALGFVVLIAGPGVPNRELMAAQRAAVSKAMALDPAMAARNQALAERIDAAMISAKTWEEAKAATTAIMAEAAAQQGMPPELAAAQAAQFGTPWYKWFINYDPRPALSALKAPVLAVNGSKDTQVVASQNLAGMRAALAANRDATVLELPGLNHLLQTADTGSPGEYARIEETIAPSALKVIGDWVVAHTRR